MARMHARKRGRSGSTRPYPREHPEWSPLGPSEVEEKVVALAREGHPPAMIGVILRDQEAVPDIKAATGKRVTQILREKDLAPSLPEDLRNLMAKALSLHEHLQENPRDTHNRRGMQLLEARIHRLIRYYKKSGRLAPEFKYSIAQAKVLVE